MITKGIIVGRSTVQGEENKYIVRIPIIHGVEGSPQYTEDKYLPTAPVCGIPGFTNVVNPGDVVYITFENDSYDNPVILGHLLLDLDTTTVNDNAGTRIDATVRTLRFFDDNNNQNKDYTQAILPQNTSIGKVTSEQLSFLRDARDNIQDQIDYLQEEIDAGGGATPYLPGTDIDITNNVISVTNFSTSEDINKLFETWEIQKSYSASPILTALSISDNILYCNNSVYEIKYNDTIIAVVQYNDPNQDSYDLSSLDTTKQYSLIKVSTDELQGYLVYNR